MTLSIAIVTISDTRTAKTDESGQLLQDYAKQSGHTVLDRIFVVDEISKIAEAFGASSMMTV